MDQDQNRSRPHSPPRDNRTRVLPCLAVVYLILSGVGLLLVRVTGGEGAVARLVSVKGLGESLGAGIAVAVIALTLSHFGLPRLRWMRRLARVVRRTIGPLSVPQAAAVGLLTGAGEEIFFRAGLQPLFGLTFTSLLFGGLHVLPPLRRNWPWTLFAVAIGFLLGGIFEQTGNLAGPVLAHAMINAVNLARIGRR
jgi:membrane protease YdiL (CAAX protease family)